MGVTRARRFPLRLVLLFRTGPADRWRRATTLEISRDRLSFVARNRMSIGTEIDMRFTVGRRPVTSEVACRGRVVRLKKPDRKSGILTYGATIEWSRLTPMALSGFP